MTEQQWLADDGFWSNIEFIRGTTTARKARLFAVACCRRVWDFMPDDHCRQAVQVAELYCDGLATKRELVEAKSRAEAVAQAVPTHFTPARSAAWAAVWVAAGGGGWLRAVHTAFSVTTREARTQAWEAFSATAPVDVAYDASQRAEREAAWAEQRQLTDLLRHHFGNPFQPRIPPPSWSMTVTQLATALYAGQDCGFALHDALLDAGHTDLADHFCQQYQHPKGCWVLDLILGKT